MVRRVLMVAFHYPPMCNSSGIQRTLKFSQYLPRFGWQPLVLTAHPRAYEATGSGQLGDIPADVEVRRAFALDTARQLSLRGRYPRMLALPDRWIAWLFGAVPAGLAMIRRARPDVLWSTYPIATAHLIGLCLRRVSGLPWVVDMRDPMSDDSYPPTPFLHRIFAAIETRAIRRCTRVVCTTEEAAAAYRRRFPELGADHFCVIENGYDEENFAAAGSLRAPAATGTRARVVLVHSGVIYPVERDPRRLFAALATLKAAGTIAPGAFELVLRAPGHEAWLAGLVAAAGIGDVVTLAPQLPYAEALAEMLQADGLLVLQDANCNHQVPAKLYEYLRARRPILALTDPAGATAGAMRRAGLADIAPLDDAHAIGAALGAFLGAIAAGKAALPDPQAVTAASRLARSGALARLLDEIVNGAPLRAAS
jgi:hypothetical protein